MKISPMASPAATVGVLTPEGNPSMSQRIRSLKMNVNRTPEWKPEEPDPSAVPDDIPPPLAAEGTSPAPELSIPDATSTALAAPEENQPLSPQLAALARERRAFQVKEKALADREKALADREAQGGAGISKQALIDNPLGTLLDNGVTWEQLTEAVVQHQQRGNPDVYALKQRMAELETGFDKKLTDRDVQQKQAALAEMKKEGEQLIAQGEDFELVRETRSMPDVMRLIEETYDKHGEVLSVREALTAIEDELLTEARKLAALKKLQGQPPSAPVSAPQAGKPPMRTLTNRDTASVPLGRKERAVAAFKGTLKR